MTRPPRAKRRRLWFEKRYAKWLATWDNMQVAVFSGLKGELPPRIRAEILNLPAFNQLNGIPFRIADPEVVWPLDDSLMAWVKGGRDSRDWRISARAKRHFSAFLASPLLAVDWNDVRLLRISIRAYLDGCIKTAAETPEEFRLAPLTIDEIAEHIKVILTEFDTPHRARLEARLDLSNEQEVMMLRLMDRLGELHQSQIRAPDRGCDYETLAKQLCLRWPKIGSELIRSGVLESFRRGWLCANGGPSAFEAGYTSRRDGMIEQESLLEQWLWGLGLSRLRSNIVFAMRNCADSIRLDQDRNCVTLESMSDSGGMKGGAPPATHSPDFRSVLWFGTDYSFTAIQAGCIKVLWKAWESGTPDVGDATLLETIDAETSRLVDLFRGNSAWGKMIVQGVTKGSRRLARPTVS